jgi:hypothetical protein
LLVRTQHGLCYLISSSLTEVEKSVIMYLKNICFIKEMFLQLFNKYVSHKYVSMYINFNQSLQEQ